MKPPLQFIDLHEDLANYFTKARGLLDMPSKDFYGSHPSLRHADIPGYKKVGTKIIFGATFPFDIEHKKLVLKNPMRRVLSDIAVYERLITGGDFFSVRTVKDLDSLNERGIGLVLHMEGGEAIKSTEDLCHLFDRGIRSFGLTWRYKNQLAGGDRTRAGLTSLGREILKVAQEKSMILDLTHLSRPSFDAAIKEWKRPCMVSHTAFKKFFVHPQNLDDKQIKAVIKRDGIIGISFLRHFYGGKFAGMDLLVDELDWFKKTYGMRNIGIGSDFFGFEIDKNLDGMKNIYALPMLRLRLIERGWTDADIDRLFWKNAEAFLRRSLPSNK